MEMIEPNIPWLIDGNYPYLADIEQLSWWNWSWLTIFQGYLQVLMEESIDYLFMGLGAGLLLGATTFTLVLITSILLKNLSRNT